VFVTESLDNFRRWDAIDDHVFAPTFAGVQHDLRKLG
jgi:hypothetical protein